MIEDTIKSGNFVRYCIFDDSDNFNFLNLGEIYTGKVTIVMTVDIAKICSTNGGIGKEEELQQFGFLL